MKSRGVKLTAWGEVVETEGNWNTKDTMGTKTVGIGCFACVVIFVLKTTGFAWERTLSG